jgi:peptidoglycan/xylan/chitin deacetylase (PgdA/CDA1 family)
MPRMRLPLALIPALVLAGCGASGAQRPATVTAPPIASGRESTRAPAPGSARRERGPATSLAPLGPGVALTDGSQPAAAAGQVTHGTRSRREIALTFDADMTRGMLAQLRSGRVAGWLDRELFAQLRVTRTPATIFLTGLWTRAYPAEVRRLARDPRFELANHSVDHAAFAAPCFGLPAVAGSAAKREEVAGAARTIERVAGVRPRYFRFPGGCARPSDVALVESAGERPVLWDVVSGDAFQRDPSVIVRTVLAQARPGSIVIAHCIGAPNTPATATAMRVIIPALRARGFHFVTLSRLLSQ